MSMRIRASLQLSLGGLLLASAVVAQAANLGFLNDTPMSYMKQPDIDSVKKAAIETLNKKQDGETDTWTNEGLRNSVRIQAQMTPDSTAKTGSRECRTLRVVLSAKGQSMNLNPQYCREGEGQWVFQKK
jgi:surface antigen